MKNNPIDYFNMELTSLGDDQRAHFDAMVAEYNEEYVDLNRKLGSEANATERQLSGQLMLLTTVMMTISVFVLSDSQLILSLTTLHKWLIVIIFLLEVTSVVSGIVNYLKVERFYINSAQEYARAAMVTQRKSYKSIADFYKQLDNVLKDRQQEARRPALYVQITCICASVIAYSALVAAILFDLPF